MTCLKRDPVLYDTANVIADAVYAAKDAEAERIKCDLTEARHLSDQARDRLVNAINASLNETTFIGQADTLLRRVARVL